MILRPKLWLIVSSLMMLAYIVLIITLKPTLGIDFIGGTLLELKSSSLVQSQVSEIAATADVSANVQTTQAKTFLVKTTPLTPAAHEHLLQALRAADPAVEELRYETVGPTIGAELRRKAWIAISLSVLTIILYLAYEFRHAGGIVRPWKLGVAAAIALVHDLLFVTAVFAILGRLYSVPIDALFITAMLALGGYSVNDTIVLFNRFKQEWLSTRRGSLPVLLDRAAKLTLIRSLNTSIPIFLTLLMLLFFGGTSIRWFIVALTAGTITGAYSTIFVAPAFLYLMSKPK